MKTISNTAALSELLYCSFRLKLSRAFIDKLNFEQVK